MKLNFLPFLVIPVVLSCANSNSQGSSETVEGTYVMQSKSEFSLAEDTLAITPVLGQNDLFSLKRSVGFQRITEKGVKAKELKQETATAIWEAGTSQLKEQKHGRIYSLSADGNQLSIGSSIYKKVAEE
ncbi:hypothetical protein HRG84_13570 [Flavisolibacter sp. BT320]|nr:hypothetical protein [Flavisolibacter longurius]